MNTLRRKLLLLAQLCAGFLALSGPLTKADQVIYDDSLVNGWQNWGWTTIDTASTAVVNSGSNSTAITPGAWAAWYVSKPSGVNTSSYGTITFWINGGPTGGQQIQVVGLLDGTGQPGVPIPALTANTWTKVSIPLVSLGVDNKTNLTGFWFQARVGSDQPTFYVDDVSLTDAVAVTPPEAVDGMGIYDDSLVNGWQNWSWASVSTGSTELVHTGASSIQVVSGGYQALSLRHSPLDTRGYSSLSFWINGGAQGGQLLRLVGTFNDSGSGGIDLPALEANKWVKLSFTLDQLGASNRSDFTGIWLQNRTANTDTAYYVDDIALNFAPPPALTQLAVNARQVVRTVDPKLFGLNAAIWDATFATATTAELLNEVDNQVLRFPGGSISDDYQWETNRSNGQTWEWATSFDEFAQIALTTQAQVFITANYGSGTPEQAANWVRYSNITKKYGFKYWEVGNENYGAWEVDWNDRPHDPVTYATRFKQYYQQMKAVDSTIKVGAVVVLGEDTDANYTDQSVVNPRTGVRHSGWTPMVLSTLKNLGVTPDYLIYHRYEQGPGGESDDYLLKSSVTWKNDAANLRQMLTDYLGAAGAKVELAVTENNSVYGNPGKQTTSLVNGLFWADSIGNIMQTEFTTMLWWDLRNGRETGNNNSSSLYGWRNYGDYGIVNGNDPAGPADRYPTFYVYKLLKHFARGGERVISATSDYNGLAIYSVAEGTRVRLLIINKKRFNTLPAKITVAGRNLGTRATLYRYGIPQDEAARTGVGSADIEKIQATGFGSTFTYEAPPFSATVIVLTTKPASGVEPGFPE